MINFADLTDAQVNLLVADRWTSAEDVWTIVNRVYKRNTIAYECEVNPVANDPNQAESRIPQYIATIPRRRHRVRSNRIFTDTEAVVNSLITNPPVLQIMPGRVSEESQELAQLQEDFFLHQYDSRNFKEVVRKALRNLYFGRLAVIKPFWNPDINDFDAKAINPTKVRISKRATREDNAEFVIEEVTDNLESMLLKFPAKRAEILKEVGLTEEQVGIQNPDISYREAHVQQWVFCVLNAQVLARTKNPYWDWDGILLTEDESLEMADEALLPDRRKEILTGARNRIGQETAEGVPTPPEEGAEGQEMTGEQGTDIPTQAYFANHFNFPRKPYIFATAFADQDAPIGRTDMISQAIPLQESVDRRKMQIDENARYMNGILKVDSKVMDKASAQKILFDPEGIIWGNGVKDGVVREYGQSLPEMVFKDMQDSREEIDNIMAASSAFRGEREGTETKAGRLALIQRSASRLEELTQVVDYLHTELFNWCYQLAKLNYTERHYAKTLGEGDAMRIIELQQDDLDDGSEIRVIPGQTLPEDQTFKYERAQADIDAGRISPIDYFRESGYQNPVDLAKNAELYKINPIKAAGVSDEELAEYAPPEQGPSEEIKPPSISISYKDLPPEGQVQLAALAGIQLSPESVEAQAQLETAMKEQDMELRAGDAELRAEAARNPQPSPKAM